MANLEKFRQEIDELDPQIFQLLGQRFAIVRRVGAFKKQESIPMMQDARMEEVKQKWQEMGAQNKLDPDFVVALYNLIVYEACRVEDGIIKSTEN